MATKPDKTQRTTSAHDFNNQLTTVLGFAEMLQQSFGTKDLLQRVRLLLNRASHQAQATAR